jgi:hypothetical protein
MERGFTERGQQFLDEARIRNERQIQESIRLQEEAAKESGNLTTGFKSRESDDDGITGAAEGVSFGVEDREGAPDVTASLESPESSNNLDIPEMKAESASQAGFGFQPQQENTIDSPEMQIDGPQPEVEFEHEPEYLVTERKTVQNVRDDAPGHLGILQAGMTYDPVETRYEVQEVKPADKNYDRFSRPSEQSFEEKLNAECAAYQQQQNDSYEAEMASSPLYRKSVAGRYG